MSHPGIRSDMNGQRRALITGVEGFTGRYLRREMASSGWDVFGIGTHAKDDDPTYRKVDLLDKAALSDWINVVAPDVVLHLAGIAFVGHGDSDAIYNINLMGSRNLLAALAASAKRPEAVLLASSSNVYGNAAGGVLDENSIPHPVNDYAVSKLAMEHMARLWLDRLPIIIARPFNYTGVGQSESFLLPKIVSHFRQRADMIELGNLDVCRDFSDVRSVVQAYRKLIEVKPTGETVNICSGRTNSLRDVLRMVEALSGHKMAVRVNPNFVRSNEVRSLSGNPAKLHRLIGDWNTPPLEDTLRWMLGDAAIAPV